MSLKFKEETRESDLKRFFLECERFDLLESTTIPEGLISTFIKKRRSLVKGLRDFRKSQNTKLMWTRHRFSIMRGVRKWTKSMAGKKFHRNLGRFLATKITENTNDLEINKYESLKAISSLKTHLLIEMEYFRASVNDDVEIESLIEYSLPLLNDIELKILESKFDKITEDELEILVRLVDENEILNSLSEHQKIGLEELSLTYNSMNVNEDLTYGLSYKFYKILNNSIKTEGLKFLMEVNDVLDT